jgi:hypothetical protein
MRAYGFEGTLGTAESLKLVSGTTCTPSPPYDPATQLPAVPQHHLASFPFCPL